MESACINQPSENNIKVNVAKLLLIREERTIAFDAMMQMKHCFFLSFLFFFFELGKISYIVSMRTHTKNM